MTLASPAELATGGPRRLRVRLVDAVDDAGLDRLRQAIAARVPGTSVEPDGPSGSGTLTVHGADVSPQLVAAVAAACASLDLLVAELQTVGRSLEERYLELTGDRSVEGALRSAEAFRRLADPDVVEQCLHIAGLLAAGDNEAQERVREARTQWAARAPIGSL